MINVTKSYLPDKKKYIEKLDQIWGNHWLTNFGPFGKDLKKQLKEYLKVSNFSYVSNGTIAIQLAIKALGLEGTEIITTPFSFVATSSTILWEGAQPVFVDVDEKTLNVDVSKIEEKINNKTSAILLVHVFGRPCDVEKIDEIARKYNLKVIYDAAHAFGVKYKNKSLLDYGDVSTCSFHATKVFHTIEGGCCVTKDREVARKIELMMKFGYEDDNFFEVGINGKNSEFHAAMGLCVLEDIKSIINHRKEVTELYNSLLSQHVQIPKHGDYEYNYCYYPVLFKNEEELKAVFRDLNAKQIYPRRYFYPSLNTLPYLTTKESCPISEDVSSRIACLPLDTYITDDQVRNICKIIIKRINNEKIK